MVFHFVIFIKDLINFHHYSNDNCYYLTLCCALLYVESLKTMIYGSIKVQRPGRPEDAALK